MSSLLSSSQHEQTGQRGRAEVEHHLAAMFQTAEVRSQILQLLLWHPEKWETQDVGAQPSVTADQRAVITETRIQFTVMYPSADNA